LLVAVDGPPAKLGNDGKGRWTTIDDRLVTKLLLTRQKLNVSKSLIMMLLLLSIVIQWDRIRRKSGNFLSHGSLRLVTSASASSRHCFLSTQIRTAKPSVPLLHY
jgi:hypothetical protein